MMPLAVFQDFLTALRDECGARLCGSFARYEHDLKGHFSDIDLVVSADGDGDARPIRKAIAIFKRFNVPGSSILVGQFSSPRDTTTLPRPIEVMEDSWIEKDKTLAKEVEVYGIKFKTFR